MSTKIGTDQGITWLKSRLLEKVSKQNEIGEKLVSWSSDQGNHFIRINGQKIRKIVRVAESNLSNSASKMGYHKITKALFGAVFIDACGSKGIGLEKCHKLFLKLWKPYLEPKNVLKKLFICFPSPKREIHQFWLKNGINLKFIKRMEHKLGVEFKKGDILCEAVIQKSFYDPIRNDAVVKSMAQPDYERLEFLGDSVLGLIVTEHVWDNYNTEKNVTEMDTMVTSLINNEYLGKIYSNLGIGEFVKMKRDRIRGWKKHGDLVESIVGAIFVDGGILKARNFVTKAFEIPILEKDFDLRLLEYKLNYSFKNRLTLIRAFRMSKGSKISTMEQIGSSILSLFLVDYKTRTCDTKADEIFLQNIDKPNIVNLSTPVLQGIASYLNVREFVEMVNDENDDWVNEHWETYVVKIFGAIWGDLTKASLYPWYILENVFYHVFNPYLLQPPKKFLLERNLNDSGAVNFRKFSGIVDKLPYKFDNPMLLCNVLEENGELLKIKLELIGLHVIHLSSSLIDTESKSNTEKLDIEQLVMNKMKDKLSVKLFMEKGTDMNEDKLTRILVGLIYADMKSKNGQCIFKRSQGREDISWLLNLSL